MGKAIHDAIPRDEPRVNLRGLLSTLGTLALFGLVFAVAIGPFRDGFGSDMIWPRASVVFGVLDGHEVAVVAYDTLGASEVAAYDTVTGERLWRTDAERQPRPLGAGAEQVVVWDDQQLRIMDLRDGSVVAEGDDVEGLDLPHGELDWWQDGDAVDPTENVVYVSTHDGFPDERPDLVRAVPLDGGPAAPLTPQQAKRWECYVESVDAQASPSIEPWPVVTVDGVEHVIAAPQGKPGGTPQRQLRVDGEPRGAVYPLGVQTAGMLVSSAAGVVVPRVCAVEWPRTADTPLAPDSGVVAALVGTEVEGDDSRLVLLDVRTGDEVHAVEHVSEVAMARTTPSGGGVIVVETRDPGPFGLSNDVGTTLVFLSADGAVTEVSV